MCMLVCKNPISESIYKEKNSNNNNVFLKEIEILRQIKKKKIGGFILICVFCFDYNKIFIPCRKEELKLFRTL